MSDFLIIGSLIGGLIGLFHAWVDFSRRMKIAPSGQAGGTFSHRAKAFYAALWILALWTIFGFYVLALWIISLPLFGVFGRLRATLKPETMD